jgi:XTP/dITP diphosphohydrolase
MSPEDDGFGRRPDEPSGGAATEVGHDVGEAIFALVALMATLRHECPWDRVQTHGSLRRHLLEEAHEVLEVLDRIEAQPIVDGAAPDATVAAALFDDLREELGDLLFQVVFHAHLATEAGRFDLADVASGVHDKLVARHPQIFASEAPSRDGSEGGSDAEDLAMGWEQAKVVEKGRRSVMDGMPHSLPALAYASKVVAKAGTIDPSLLDGIAVDGPVVDGLAVDVERPEQELGRQLLAIVRDARAAGLDAESALRGAAAELEAVARAREGSMTR